MSGLFEKDFRLIVQNRQSLLLLTIIAIGIGITQDSTFILGYFPFCVVAFVTSLLSYDEADNGLCFLMTLPVDTKTYVKEKYLLSEASVVISWIMADILYLVSQTIHKKTFLFTEKTFLMMLPFLAMAVLVFSVIIPVRLKFGMEKSRFVLLGCCGVLAAVVAFFEVTGTEKLHRIITAADGISDGVAVGISAGLILLAPLVSYFISRNIMDKKEF